MTADSHTVDVIIAEIHGLLLDRLEEKLRTEAPRAVQWFELDLALPIDARRDAWRSKLGSFDAGERRVLQSLLDVFLGIGSVRLLSRQSLDTLSDNDSSAFRFVTNSLSIAGSALLEGLDALAKRASRADIINQAAEEEMRAAVAERRENDPLLGIRNASAHGSFAKGGRRQSDGPVPWMSAPLHDRLWEMVALQSPREPLDRVLHTELHSGHRDEVARRLSRLESATESVLSVLLRGLRAS